MMYSSWGRHTEPPSSPMGPAPKVTYTLSPSKTKTVGGAPFYGGVTTPSSSGGTV